MGIGDTGTIEYIWAVDELQAGEINGDTYRHGFERVNKRNEINKIKTKISRYKKLLKQIKGY